MLFSFQDSIPRQNYGTSPAVVSGRKILIPFRLNWREEMDLTWFSPKLFKAVVLNRGGFRRRVCISFCQGEGHLAVSLLTRTIWLYVWKIDIPFLKQKVRSQRHFVPKDMQKISQCFVYLWVSLFDKVVRISEEWKKDFTFFQKRKKKSMYL